MKLTIKIIMLLIWASPSVKTTGRAIGYIFCSAIATQKDVATIPHAKQHANKFDNFQKVVKSKNNTKN